MKKGMIAILFSVLITTTLAAKGEWEQELWLDLTTMEFGNGIIPIPEYLADGPFSTNNGHNPVLGDDISEGEHRKTLRIRSLQVAEGKILVVTGNMYAERVILNDGYMWAFDDPTAMFVQDDDGKELVVNSDQTILVNLDPSRTTVVDADLVVEKHVLLHQEAVLLVLRAYHHHTGTVSGEWYVGPEHVLALPVPLPRIEDGTATTVTNLR